MEEKTSILDLEVSLCGRRKIFTTSDEITADNVVSVLNLVLSYHIQNLLQEEYLYWYRRGIQPILLRKKEIRPEICNKTVINNANQICVFKNGYFMTAPASYSSRVDDETITEKVKQFNDFCTVAQKPIVDNELVDWFHTTGLGVLYVEPDRDGNKRKPICVSALDPRSAFVVYSLRPGNPAVMGVNMVAAEGKLYFDVFTRDRVYKIEGGYTGRLITNRPIEGTAITIISEEANIIGEIPIIEYQYDNNRMSCFEVAIPIMDEINNLTSNLADGIEQQIQQLCVAYNCNFDEGTTANDIRAAGMLVLRSQGDNKADFKILESKLSQAETQTNIDALYTQLLDKTGLPSINRNEGGSSDNGSAVYLKSGYTIADTTRRNTEDCWRKSDEQFKKVALAILNRTGFGLEPEDMELNIEPPTMSNLLVKTQAALNMRELGLAPEIWLERSGLSNDPLLDIELSKDYIYEFYGAEEASIEENPDETPEEQVEQEGEALADDRQIEELSSYELD